MEKQHDNGIGTPFNLLKFFLRVVSRIGARKGRQLFSIILENYMYGPINLKIFTRKNGPSREKISKARDGPAISYFPIGLSVI